MSSEKIIKNCAPTLAGIKTANLFNEYFTDKEKLLTDIRNFNKNFADKGLRMSIIAIKDNRALIYVFRVNDLKRDFENCLSKDILTSYGYETTNIYKALQKLSYKVDGPNEFPHEIGLFLGYPPEDVKGFIDNKGQNFKTFGCWKVYGDEKKAKQTFKSYKTYTERFLSMFKMGYSLKQLVISK